ncbi:MAG: glycosyltransferase [Dethiobacter sp.]|jgi:glycosyltransferase involved in cell wall biosynthesis|nr:glycosyltransferase [Dethiobacter sp.]
MKILIIVYSFPPLNRIASQRPFSWAKYWSRLGHEVTVLTKEKTGEDGPLNLEYSPNSLKDVRMLELKAWPFRLKRSDANKLNNISILHQLRRYIDACRVLGHADFWGFSAVRMVSKLHSVSPFDLVVSTYGPYGSHLVASRIKRSLKIDWVADYRDLWHGNHVRPKKWPLNVIEDNFEKHFVKSADLITAVSEGLNNKLSARFNRIVYTIENGFDEDDLPAGSEERYFPDDGKIRIAYTGTIYKGFQDPSPLFEALAGLKQKGCQVEDKIRILFYGSRMGNLHNLINRYGLDSMIVTPGFVSRQECLRIQRSVDALLFLEWEGPSGEDIITGKIFEYLYSGRPILSVGGGLGKQPGLIERYGAGVALGNSPQLIADILEKIIGGYKISYRLSEEQLKQFSRKYLAEKMLSLIMEWKWSRRVAQDDPKNKTAG